LYENAYSDPPENNYFAVELIGAESNRPGIGAHVVLRYEDDQSNRTQQMAEVAGGGSGAGSQGSLPLEFGIGQVSSVDSVLVYWPSGDTSIFENVATNQRITVVEHGYFNDHDLVWDHNLHGHYYISGNVTIQGIELEIAEGTHVYFHKTWRTDNRAKLLFSVSASLTISGTEDNPVILTSQYSSPKAGDWEGMYTMLSTNSISLDFAQISYGNYGFYGWEYLSYAPGSIDITDCRFTNLKSAGVDLAYPSINTATQITNCYFENCGSYGIRIRKDILSNDLDVIIEADTVLNCQYGICYFGNSNLGYTKIPSISNCVIQRTVPTTVDGYGIFISSFSAANPFVSPRIESDSIVGFYGGINLSSVNSNCKIVANKVKNNSDYGIYLKNASPDIFQSTPEGIPNVFNSSYVGMYCDKSSSPYVRSTKIKENIYRGVLVDAATPPDFGTASSHGGNSIHTEIGLMTFADMHYTVALPQLNAVGNWWGEYPPNRSEIIGNIKYSDALESDPLPGYEKREARFVDLPDGHGLGQNFPNPFNPITTLSFYLAAPGFASLKIYNLNGQLVNTLVSDQMGSGEHTVIWDSKNSAGQEVSSGIYFYILDTDYGRASKKMILLR
jgi:parallel beta-helix repeat protein